MNPDYPPRRPGSKGLLLAALASSIALPGTSAAQSASVERPAEVTVTARRVAEPLDDVPAAIAVVAGADVQEARQQLGLDESLAAVPGLFMQNRFNFAQDLRISIRGFGARSNFGIRGIRIFVDGIPETLPDGQGQVDSIDLGSVKQVTVVRGSSSALYGNASGGVILIESEDAPDHPVLELRSAFGNYGYGKYQLKAAGSAGKLGYMLSASDLETDGYRAQSAARSRVVNGTLTYGAASGAHLRVALNYTDQPISDDAGALTRAQVLANPRQAAAASVAFDGGESLDQKRIGLVYEHPLGDDDSVSARNYYVWRTFANTLAFQAAGAVTIDRFFTGGGLAYTHKGRLFGWGSRTVLGLDVDRQDDDRRRYDNLAGTFGALTFDQNERVTNTGYYFQNELELLEDLQLTLGARHDRVRFAVDDRFGADGNDSGARTLSRTSPVAAILYRMKPQLTLYATASTSFETPTTAEFASPSGGGGFNPALGPQLATQYELGVRGALGAHGRFDAALFRIGVTDELVPFEVPGSPGRSFYVNAGKSRRHGLELSTVFTPLDSLQLSLAYTLSKFEFTEFTDATGVDYAGNRIPGLPQHVAHGGIAWRSAQGFYTALDALYISSLFLDNANAVRDGGYALADLRVGFTRGLGRWNWALFAGANNVLDRSYNANTRINAAAGRYFEPGPERNLYSGLTLRYRFSD